MIAQLRNPTHLMFASLVFVLMIQTCLSACDASCATCSGTTNITCLSCASPRFLFNKTCITTCPDGYYGNTTSRTCASCHSSCATCSGGTNITCLTCSGLNYLLSTNNSCGTTCPSNYFKDTNNTCTLCHSSCATCSNASSTGCITCTAPNYFLSTNNSCGTTCPSNYFKGANQVCTGCHTSCATCTNSTNITCSSCASPNYFLSTNNSCSTTCPSNYFKDANQICTKCHTSCGTCTDDTNTTCSSCSSPNYYLASNKSCSTSCPSGFFKNTGQICSTCHSTCATCSGSTNKTCTSCASPNYLLTTNNSCGLACPTGYYGENSTRTCLKCDTTCGTCNGTTSVSCLTCSAPRYWLPLNNSCVTTCPTNYFKDSQQQCTKCDSSCATCSDEFATSCLTCPFGQILVTSNNSCAPACPANHFMDTNNLCTKCDSSCGSCNGTANNNCNSCSNPNYFLTQSRTCVNDCGTGYFSISQVCYKCNENCVTCNGSSWSCTSCLSGQFLVNSSKQCVATCPTNSYVQGSACIDCDSNCATCAQDPKKCLTCAPGYDLNKENNTCFSLCQQNYQWKNDGCKYVGACDITCANGQCNAPGPGQCTTCRDPNSTFYNGGCSCASGFQMSKDGFCIAIPSNDIKLDCTTFDASDPNCIIKQTLLPKLNQTNDTVSYSSSTFTTAMQPVETVMKGGSMSISNANDTSKNLTIKVPTTFTTDTASNASSVVLVTVARLPTAFNAQNSAQNITSTVATLIFVDATTQEVLPVTNLREPINITFPMTDESYKNYYQYVKSHPEKFPSQNMLYILSSIFTCRFWNTTTNSWMSNGVTMVDMTESSITCATVHTTEFGIEFKDMGFENLTDAPVFVEPDTSNWHIFVTTSYVDNIGVYVVFVVGIMYLISSTGGFFADFLSARAKKGGQKQLLPWWFASEGRQIMEKLATGDLTRVVYSLAPQDTQKDVIVNLKDIEVNLPQAKDTQPVSPATVMGGPQSEGEQSAMRPSKPKYSGVIGSGVIDFNGDYPTGPQLPQKTHQLAMQSEIHISTPSGPVSNCTLFKEYILMLHPLINLIFVSTPFFSPRPTRALMYFGSILAQLMFATLFFQPISETSAEIDAGTIIWQGIVVWVMSSVVMYIISMISMLRKHHITEILAADPNDAENRLKNFMIPIRIRSILMYSVGVVLITGSLLWIMVFCAVNGWSKSMQWLEVFIVTVLFDQIVFESAFVTLLVFWKSRSENRKRLIVMKYKKVMLVG